ncbi:hypothetical protein A1O1_04359 [Capronia coronata CBS 617.96]|uniref:Zn(2)-C6 fungal-type domain-containing protein n=1 Tax=Capronia coronata CBS 617.96 TaxID=1182541 RepID=W9Z9P9_9EURO|nr:uncharacterized protein A1O1_04359 [Capronia coronata CBS 617.96]EXJ91249.1 hypothetical protein A1O1_04359 [Capronia coronata CBS 617.96]
MASTATSQTEPTSSGYSKTARRQYQSCDQCRKSRRACDAGTLRVVNFPFAEDDTVSATFPTCEACSNCAKSGKKCSFDWLRTLPLHGLPKGIKRKLELTGFPEPADARSNPASETHIRPSLIASPSLPRDSSSSSIESIPAFIPESNENVEGQSLAHAKYTHSPYSSFGHETTVYNPSPNVPDIYLTPNAAPNGPSPTSQKTANISPHALSVSTKPSIRWSVPTFNRYDTSSSSASSRSLDSRTTTFSSQAARSASSICSDSSREQESADTSSPKQVRCIAQPGRTCDPLPKKTSSSALPPSTSPASAAIATASRRPSISSALPTNGRSTPLSPHQVRFADGAMKSMIATGLLRIYHDSFENALSCWVTERNCPYETELHDLIAQPNDCSAADEAAFRLGDNRIFSRVSRLDSAFAQLRGRDLTMVENRTASKALNAAIMAFASQWSHSSHNSFWKSKEGRTQMKAWQSRSRNEVPDSAAGTSDPILSSECERLIQKTLWHEARTAIQATTEIDSFKVILAHMIFALTQRPLDDGPRSPKPPDSTKVPDGNTGGGRASHGGPSADGGYAQSVDLLVNEDWDPFSTSDLETISSPAVYLETAVRNLFSWRRKIERHRRKRMRSCRTQAGDPPRSRPLGAVAVRDQQTFNILFWLGIMCDTTSSAITKRPLIIPDEDCAMIRDKMHGVVHDGQHANNNETTSASNRGSIDLSDDFGLGLGLGINVNAGHGVNVGVLDAEGSIASTEHCHPNGPSPTDNDLWGDYLLKFNWAGPRPTPPRWPCTFDQAALVLQEAIPVKVLLYRKVSQLQTLAYRRSPAHLLEKCIEEALAVYQHWNSTYQPFMRDCVHMHDQLPARVQSWYVILDGHWHYGCLLLADAIAQVDQDQQTMAPQRTLRARCGLIGELRRDNATAVADIARASLAEHAPEVPDNADFSFACNGSAILTEPWTDVLVRAMGSACQVFMDGLARWDDRALDRGFGTTREASSNGDWVMGGTGGGGGGGGGGRSGDVDYDDSIAKAEICIQGMVLLGRKSDAANRTAEIFWARLNKVVSAGRRSMPREDYVQQGKQPSSLREDLVAGLDLNFLSTPHSIRC